MINLIKNACQKLRGPKTSTRAPKVGKVVNAKENLLKEIESTSPADTQKKHLHNIKVQYEAVFIE